MARATFFAYPKPTNAKMQTRDVRMSKVIKYENSACAFYSKFKR